MEQPIKDSDTKSKRPALQQYKGFCAVGMSLTTTTNPSYTWKLYRGSYLTKASKLLVEDDSSPGDSGPGDSGLGDTGPRDIPVSKPKDLDEGPEKRGAKRTVGGAVVPSDKTKVEGAPDVPAPSKVPTADTSDDKPSPDGSKTGQASTEGSKGGEKPNTSTSDPQVETNEPKPTPSHDDSKPSDAAPDKSKAESNEPNGKEPASDASKDKPIPKSDPSDDTDKVKTAPTSKTPAPHKPSKEEVDEDVPKGKSSSSQNSESGIDPGDKDDGDRFLFLGKADPRFIRVNDLLPRITGTDTYEVDWARAKTGLAMIPVWHISGTTRGQNDPYSWCVKPTAAYVRRPKVVLDAGEAPPPQAKRTRKDLEVSPGVRAADQQKKWNAVANQVQMATGPKKDYNVMARFWLPAAEQRDFNLVFEPSQYISKDQLLEAVKTAMILIVPPIPYELNGEGESRKAGLKQFSEHYLGLYSIWMSEDDIKKARGYAGAALPRDIPTEAQAKEADDMLKLKNLKLRRTTATTVVSASKISRASGMRKTTDDQLTIMGKSATDFAKLFWGAKNKDKTEWLHRSAFSFGGLGESGNYHTSQVRENFVFGTSSANTCMIRAENVVKDTVKADDAKLSESAVLVTDIEYPEDDASKWMEQRKFTWLAPELTYSFTYKNKAHNIAFNSKINFNTFDLWVPLRLEAQVDAYVLKDFYDSVKPPASPVPVTFTLPPSAPAVGGTPGFHFTAPF